MYRGKKNVCLLLKNFILFWIPTSKILLILGMFCVNVDANVYRNVSLFVFRLLNIQSCFGLLCRKNNLHFGVSKTIEISEMFCLRVDVYV